MCLGENIRFLRKQRNMSQETLANKLGYKSYTTIQKWESGVSEPPIKSLRKIADIFSVDMDALADTRLSDKPLSCPNLDLNSDETALLSSFRLLNDDGRSEAQAHMAYLCSQDRYIKDIKSLKDSGTA